MGEWRTALLQRERKIPAWKDAAHLYGGGGQGRKQTNHMAHLQTQALPPVSWVGLLDSFPTGDRIM